jgi:hypothetical protein
VRGLRQLDQPPRVVDVKVPGGDDGALAVTAPVTRSVDGVHRGAVGVQPAGEGVVEAQVLSVAVQEDEDADDVAVRHPGGVVDGTDGTAEVRHRLEVLPFGGAGRCGPMPSNGGGQRCRRPVSAVSPP